jgi:hypothetical protein
VENVKDKNKQRIPEMLERLSSLASLLRAGGWA